MGKTSLFIIPISFFLFFGLAFSAQAANHYIRDGANGDGSDWTNASDDLPTTFVRGDTYYVADGNYGAHIFGPTTGDAAQYVTIKKATQANYGNGANWQSEYGNGQAVFSSPASNVGTNVVWAIWEIKSSNWEFDGVIGEKGGNYGIKLQMEASGIGSINSIRIGEKELWNLKFKHLDLAGRGFAFNLSDRGFNIDSNAKGRCGNFTFEYCYIHDVGCPFHTPGAGFVRVPTDLTIPTSDITENVNNITIDHCYFARNKSTAEWHSEGIQGGGNNLIVRHSVFEDIEGTAIASLGYSKGVKMYGNVFLYSRNYPSADQSGLGITYVMGCNTSLYCDNFSMFNNVIYNIQDALNTGISHGIDGTTKSSSVYGQIIGKTPTTFDVYNNIWHSSPGVNLRRINHDYNYFFNSATIGTTQLNSHEEILNSFDYFINEAAYNFYLKKAFAGFSFPPEATALEKKDPDGNVRGADGVWDVGAYEFTDGQVTCAQGDIDCDGDKDITDIQIAVNLFLGIENDQTKKDRADFNNDDSIAIDEIQKIVNIFLGILN